MGLDPGIAIVAPDDLVGHEALMPFDHRIVITPADQPLNGGDGIVGIGDGLPFCRLADQHLAGAGESNHRGRYARALRVFDHFRLAGFDDGNAEVGGAQIDPDDFWP